MTTRARKVPLHEVYTASGYVALMLYPIGIPLGIAWILRGGAKGNKLDDPNFKAKFGFLYGMYRPEFVAWELAGLLTKLILAAIPIFATEVRNRPRAPGTRGVPFLSVRNSYQEPMTRMICFHNNELKAVYGEELLGKRRRFDGFSM